MNKTARPPASQSKPSDSPLPLVAQVSWMDHWRLRTSGRPSASDTSLAPEALGLSGAALRLALTSVGDLVHTAAPPLMPGVFHFFGSCRDEDVEGVVRTAGVD